MKLVETYPIKLCCRVLDYPRSLHYYRPRQSDDPALQAALSRVAGEWPTYGYRRITAQLRREGWVVNSKRVRRLMRKLRPPKPQRRRTTRSDHLFPCFPNLVADLAVVRPDQVWVGDITYIRLQREFVYLAVLMDVFTRGIRGWQLSRSLDCELTLTALRRALSKRVPQIHHSDQGIHYATPTYVAALGAAGVRISMAQVGEAWQNGYAERLIRTIKEEEVDLSEYEDYADAYRQIGRFLDEVYMHKRIHSSLGYLTPVEFESQWRAERVEMELVEVVP